ncbi:MAG: PQQ-binding-like beta-propeller repeat protein [Planctomycetota bacterium]
MTLNRVVGLVCVATVVCASAVRAENWPNWRGPNYDGSTSETNLPDTLNLDKNLAWKVAAPGRGGATPIIWGDKVFISSADDATKELYAVCYNRKDGAVLWKQKLSSNDTANGRNNSASPSPVTDGSSVYFLYGNGDLAGLDMDGKILWQKNIVKDYGTFSIQWGYGNSPLLFKGKLYITVLRRDKWKGAEGTLESFLLALSPKDGSVIWKHVRPTDAVAETQESYATPMPVEVNGKTQLLINDGEYMTGHDPETGTELWRFGSYTPTKNPDRRMVVSPIAGAGHFYCTAAKTASPIYGVKLDGLANTVKTSAAAWTIDEKNSQPDCTTPLFYNNNLFVMSDKMSALMKIEPKTGKKIWSGSLLEKGKGVFRASPTGGDGKVYLVRVTGEAYVFSAGDEYKVLSELALGEGSENIGCVSSVAISGGNVFVRTPKHLYCFKK